MIQLNNSACTKCTVLCKTRRQVINGTGPIGAKIMVIIDGPSIYDDKSGRLLDSYAGSHAAKSLNLVLSLAGIPRNELFITSLIRCVAHDPENRSTRPATPEEAANCYEYLDAEIKAVNPTVIIPMGEGALSAVLGLKKCKITKYRGVETWSAKYNCKVIATFDVEKLVMAPKLQSVMISDFTTAKASSMYREMTVPKESTYITIDNIELFDQMIDKLLAAPKFAFDIETNGLNFLKNFMLCVSFSWAERTGVCLPLVRYVPRYEKQSAVTQKPIKKKDKVTKLWVNVGFKDVVKEWTVTIDEYEPYWGDKQEYVLGRLKEVMESKVPKIAHNGKFDIKFFTKMGITVTEYYLDTMLAHFLLDENLEGLHGLKDCSVMYTDMGHYDEPLEAWFKERRIKEADRNYAHLPTEMLYKYACMDTDCTIRLANRFEPELDEEQLREILERLIMPLSNTLMDAEYAGVLIDIERTKQLGDALRIEIKKLEDALEAKVGKMNFASNDQLVDLLFVRLKLPIIKMTEGKEPQPCTDESVLTALKDKHPVPALLLEHRGLNKLLGTYVEGLLERLDEFNYIHTEFRIHGAVTGRLASRNPNLQNIPRFKKAKKGEVLPVAHKFGNEIKNLFIPRPGYIFVEADYGQAEFRHWANYSQDPAMLKDLANGVDIHRQTAAALWKIKPEDVTKEQRQAAKSIVFGLMFGMQLKKLVRQLWEEEGIVLTEAQGQAVIDDFFRRYPKAEEWLKAAINTVKKYKQIRNVFGRLRRLPGIDSSNNYIRSESERQATNSPIQGAASDMNCNAANRLTNIFKEMGMDARLCILVHDSMLFEIPEDKGLECARIIHREMIRPIEGVTAPMIAELKMGKSWGECVDIKPAELVEAA